MGIWQGIRHWRQWKGWNFTAGRIRAVHQPHAVQSCCIAGSFGSRFSVRVWKKASLELARPWKQLSARSTPNTLPVCVRPLTDFAEVFTIRTLARLNSIENIAQKFKVVLSRRHRLLQSGYQLFFAFVSLLSFEQLLMKDHALF